MDWVERERRAEKRKRRKIDFMVWASSSSESKSNVVVWFQILEINFSMRYVVCVVMIFVYSYLTSRLWWLRNCPLFHKTKQWDEILWPSKRRRGPGYLFNCFSLNRYFSLFLKQIAIYLFIVKWKSMKLKAPNYIFWSLFNSFKGIWMQVSQPLLLPLLFLFLL